MPFVIRPAHPEESGALTRLARAAKAHRGYPPEWMRQWERDLTIPAEYIRTHGVFVAVEAERILGVGALEALPEGWSIEHLWVEPGVQGQGVGTALVRHLLAEARSLRAGIVTLCADPGAAGFYERLGARPTGSVPAPMPGAPDRVLPLYEFTVGAR